MEAAAIDLEDIRSASVRKWGTATWAKRAENFDEAFERIARFPASGRDRSEFLDGMRSVAVKPHVIFFREAPDFIVIMRVVDGRRDLPKLSFVAP